MQKEPDSLPDDIDKLKSLVRDQATLSQNLTLQNKQLETDKNIAVTKTKRASPENTVLKSKVLSLQKQLNLVIARRGE
ncbi:hypothetical protein MNBD_GAMMA12-3303 [hydrothermal vent metagenome]|uniref:Uncharacterized protein n=1 Tax=hydrothermal vent metagenome TaxID=652676 RepID=A0A3B0YH70_9ZZZZ